MKRLILFLLCASILGAQGNVVRRRQVVASGGGSATLVQYKEGHGTNGSGTVTTTFDSSVVSGHGVILMTSLCIDAGCGYIGSAITATPPTGAIAAPGSPYLLNSNSMQMDIWYIPNASAGTAFTITYASGVYYAGVAASEWTGLATTSPFDQATASGSTTAVTSATVTPSNTTNANDLIIGFIGMIGSAHTVTLGTGFSLAGQTTLGIQNEYRVVSSTGSWPCTWTFSSDQWNGSCAAIKLQ